MACFLVPLGEVVVTTAVKKVVEKNEAENAESKISANSLSYEEKSNKISWSRKLGWLNNLLWGGCLLLAFEHLWHGEIVPWPPFLTAMENPADIAPMLHEMGTIGVGMAIFVTLVWLVMVAVADKKAEAIPAATTKAEA